MRVSNRGGYLQVAWCAGLPMVKSFGVPSDKVQKNMDWCDGAGISISDSFSLFLQVVCP